MIMVIGLPYYNALMFVQWHKKSQIVVIPERKPIACKALLAILNYLEALQSHTSNNLSRNLDKSTPKENPLRVNKAVLHRRTICAVGGRSVTFCTSSPCCVDQWKLTQPKKSISYYLQHSGYLFCVLNLYNVNVIPKQILQWRLVAVNVNKIRISY